VFDEMEFMDHTYSTSDILSQQSYDNSFSRDMTASAFWQVHETLMDIGSCTAGIINGLTNDRRGIILLILIPKERQVLIKIRINKDTNSNLQE
jgi:hypothetical protein